MKNFFRPAPATYLGYQSADYAKPYAKYFTPQMAALPPHITDALAQSPQPAEKMLAHSDAAQLAQPGYLATENGFALTPDGAATIAVLTLMPGVTPASWDWWFGWHGSHSDRYKLWHPQAHQSARWRDGVTNQVAYLGRTSLVEEYIGPRLAYAAIRFVPPEELGFTAPANLEREVFICARFGYARLPLDFGWLLHQVRAVAGGAEMRSRFWLGGPHLEWRGAGAVPPPLARGLARAIPLAQQARYLLSHCAEEMNHLAAFLPALYAEFKHDH